MRGPILTWLAHNVCTLGEIPGAAEQNAGHQVEAAARTDERPH